MSDIRNYAFVTAAYWVFTLTDGALRMLVLLYFHSLGFTPLDLAFLFLLYEAMGIVTNFLGGWLAAKYGLRMTLLAGLMLQIIALLVMSAVRPDWLASFSLAYVMAAQALSGVAKDLTKMSSKSAVKLVVSVEAQGLLFHWGALLTGSKNTLKGFGFLLGGVMLNWLGFQVSMWSMAGTLGLVLAGLAMGFSGDLGKAKEITRRDLFAKRWEINYLSAARVFLFAARDVWFVVGVKVFLYSELGWSFTEVAAFMAIWVIGYGAVQAMAPRLLRSTHDISSAVRGAVRWGGILAIIPGIMALLLGSTFSTALPPAMIVLAGIYLFGIIFALNSAIHSYLIVAFADRERVSMDVGFYYMANAVGRFIGTLLSGVVFQFHGLGACLWVSATFVAMAVLLTLPLRQAEAVGSESENLT
ncbi:MAG: organoarsenical effux MFS transporter ArsJ [Rhodospirillaceae bacterium]|nr:organoarsenical effux MFS transporter ArsJ [Rhodospirillaceae bacterium]